MIEPQDQAVLNMLMNKSETKAVRKESQVAFDKQMKHKKRANKQYSSLYNMPAPIHTFARKKDGKLKKKVPKKLRRHQQRYLNPRTSMLNDIQMDNNNQKSDDILITDMDKEKYLNLMKKNEQKSKQVRKHLNSNLADFVEETNRIKMSKLSKNMIDLTVNSFINDKNGESEDLESTDIEILNGDIEVYNKSLYVSLFVIGYFDC